MHDEIEAAIEQLHQITGLPTTEFKQQERTWKNVESMTTDLINFLLERYDLFRNQGTHQEIIQQAEKWLVLEVIDQAWKQHMLNIDHLQEGISLRSWGQKNPLVEYKKEAFAMFEEMMDNICSDVVRHIFHVNIERFNQHAIETKRRKELEQLNMISEVVTSEAGEKPMPKEAEPKIGRNDACPCGSGKKFKKCHGAAYQ